MEAEKEFSTQAILYVYGGDICKHLKMYDRALAYWDKSLELNPEISASMWSKASCYEELGNYQAAYDIWIELIAWLEERGYEIEVAEPRRLAQNCKDKLCCI